MIIGGLGKEEDLRAFREVWERCEVWEREIAGSRECVILPASAYGMPVAKQPPSFWRAIGMMLGALAVHGLVTTLVRVMFSPLSRGGELVPLFDGKIADGIYALLTPPTQDQIMNDELARTAERVGWQTSI